MRSVEVHKVIRQGRVWERVVAPQIQETFVEVFKVSLQVRVSELMEGESGCEAHRGRVEHSRCLIVKKEQVHS